MQLSPILSLVGMALIVTGAVLHIVCLATPHFAGADSSGMADKLKAVMEKKIPPGTDPATRQQIEEAMQQSLQGGNFPGDLNYGLWKICFSDAGDGFCANWASKTKIDKTSQTPKSIKIVAWIQGAQAMALLGLLVAVGAGVLAAIHVFVPSRGDRLRLLPVFICVACLLAGAIVLCGDIIVGVKYNTILMDFAEQEGESKPPPDVQGVLESLFFLSWGFALDVVAAAFLFLSGLFFVLAGRASSEAGGLV